MKKIMILIISLVLLAPLVFSYDEGSAPNPGSDEPQYYDNAKVVRVKYTQGEAYVKRSYDEGLEEAALNLPVFEKDTAGTTDGRLEIYMGRLNYLRLDYDTEVVFDKIPELRKTDMSVRILHGGVYLDVDNLDYERDIEVQTPDCGVFLLDKGQYRINVSEGGHTEIFVYDGMAEVAGDDYNRNVRGNQKVVMLNGEVKERPFYFYSADKDDFDRWNQDRSRIDGYARYSSSSYLDDGYGEYEYELSRQGRWRYDSTYNSNIWIPYNVDADWRPYYNGRWVYNPYYGNVWMSFDSWGYFTHHYGRWQWSPIYHWYWVPGYRWSPAWVSWFGDDSYYGWCPLSWWNRPVIVINGHWNRNYDYRHGIPRNAHSTTIIRKNQLAAPRIQRAALTRGELSKMSGKSFVFKGRAPNLRPSLDKVNVINARGKAVVYKNSGVVTASKYKVIKGSVDLTKLKDTQNSPVYKYSGEAVSKDRVSKYSKSGSSTDSSFRVKSSKYAPSTSSRSVKYGSSGSEGNTGSSGKLKDYSSDSGSDSKSGYKYRSKSGSSSRSSSGSSSSSSATVKKSSVKSSSSKKSSGSKSTPVKKKKESPSFAYSSSSTPSSSSYSSTPYSSKKYSSKYESANKPVVRSSSSYSSRSQSSYESSAGSEKTYKPSSSSRYYSTPSSPNRTPTKSYSSSSSYRSASGSSYKTPTRSSGSSSSSSSSYTPRSSSSSSSYSSPRSSSSSSSSTRTGSSSVRSSSSSSHSSSSSSSRGSSSSGSSSGSSFKKKG